ncbi:hypothetical protein [Salisaeta longa]|uniref:hypothetical protein n=1 Tax=Salisaeta longa TaxID=503170 RepID=UPI0003B30AF5|nr:hypothetical protein [Salisaeta longa]
MPTDTLIAALTAQLHQSLPATQAYRPEDWAGRVPPPVEHFLKALARHQSIREADRLEAATSGWVNYDAPALQDAAQQFWNAVQAHPQIPADAWADACTQAARYVVQYLVDPAQTLAAFTYADVDGAVPTARVERHLDFFQPYGYLARALSGYIEKRGLDTLTAQKLTTFIAYVDAQYTSDYAAAAWQKLLRPLFDLAAYATGTRALRAGVLRQFFEAREAEACAQALPADDAQALTPDALMEHLAPSEAATSAAPPDWFVNEVQRTDDAPSGSIFRRAAADDAADDASTGSAPADETSAEDDDAPPAPSEPAAAPSETSDAPEASDTSEGDAAPDAPAVDEPATADDTAADDTAADEEPSPWPPPGTEWPSYEDDEASAADAAPGAPSADASAPDSAGTDDTRAGASADDEPAPLWKRFQSSDDENAKARTEPADASSAAEEEKTPLWARFQSEKNQKAARRLAADESSPEAPADQAAAPAADTDAPDAPRTPDADASQRASAAEPAEPSAPAPSAPADTGEPVSVLEEDVLGANAEANRAMYVRQLFSGNIDAYERVLRRLRTIETWSEASQFIAQEVFRKHKVNIYSDAAVSFTDAVEARYE